MSQPASKFRKIRSLLISWQMHCKAFESLIGTVCMPLSASVHAHLTYFSLFFSFSVAVCLKVLMLECLNFSHTTGSVHCDGWRTLQLDHVKVFCSSVFVMCKNRFCNVLQYSYPYFVLLGCRQRCTGSGFQDSSPAGFSTFWTNRIGSGLRFYSSFRIRIFKFHWFGIWRQHNHKKNFCKDLGFNVVQINCKCVKKALLHRRVVHRRAPIHHHSIPSVHYQAQYNIM